MPRLQRDRRPQKTRKVLKNVLVDLLQTRDLQSISIKEITDLADISRGTFYLHFDDIFALYQAIESDVIEQVSSIIQNKVPIQDEGELDKIINAIFEYLTIHMKECDALLRTDSASFLSGVFEKTRPQVAETWEMPYGSREQMEAYSYIFMSHGLAGVLKHWMAFGKIETPRQLAEIIKPMLSYLVFESSQNQSALGMEKGTGNQP